MKVFIFIATLKKDINTGASKIFVQQVTHAGTFTADLRRKLRKDNVKHFCKVADMFIT